jgi:hypothetical protein
VSVIIEISIDQKIISETRLFEKLFMC